MAKKFPPLARPKRAFKTALIAWKSLAKQTGLKPSDVTASHTAKAWFWKVKGSVRKSTSKSKGSVRKSTSKSKKRTSRRSKPKRKVNRPKSRPKSVAKKRKSSGRKGSRTFIDKIPLLKNKTVQRIGFGLGMGSIAALVASRVPVPIIQSNAQLIGTGISFATDPLSGVVRLALSGGLGQLGGLLGGQNGQNGDNGFA